MTSRRSPLSIGDGPPHGTPIQRSSTPSARASQTGELKRGVGLLPKAFAIPSASLKARITVPVVVFAGLDDPIVEPSDYRGAARMFESEYIVEEVPGGHFMHREHPETFAERLLAHL
jgi:pimeloyl-ACP methyl ester carboxylesterase